MRTQTLGSTPALLITGGALMLCGLIASAVGVTFSAAQPAPQPPTTQGPEIVDVDTSLELPARTFITKTLGKDLTWGRRIPTKFACQPRTPALSATNTNSEGIHVFSAGTAREAFMAMQSCGTILTLNEAPAVEMSSDGGSVILWLRGDVVASYAGEAKTARANAQKFDDRLIRNLVPLCASTSMDAQTPERNPLHPTYTQFIETRSFALDPVEEPDINQALTEAGFSTALASKVGLESDLPATTDVTPGSVPERLQGPLLPHPSVTQPALPDNPGPQPTSQNITLPAPDLTGPGCGWAFALTAPPVQDVDAMNQAFTDAFASQASAIEVDQQQWRARATAYYALAAQYLTDRDSWEAYAKQVRSVHEAWDVQLEALDKFDRLVRERDEAIAAAELFDTQYADEQATWEANKSYCAALPPAVEPPTTESPVDPSPTPEDPTAPPTTPDPTPEAPATPTPTPTPPGKPGQGDEVKTVALRTQTTCPAPKPAILSRQRPAIPPAPEKPELWEPHTQTEEE